MAPAPERVCLHDEWGCGDCRLQIGWSRPGLPVLRPMISGRLELHIDCYLEEDGRHQYCQVISMPIHMRAASRLATMRGAREAILSDVLMEDYGPLPMEAVDFLAEMLSRYIRDVAAATARTDAGWLLTEVQAKAHVRLFVDDDPEEEEAAAAAEDTEWEDMAVDDNDYTELPSLSTGEDTRRGEEEEEEEEDDPEEEMEDDDDNDDWEDGDYRGGLPSPSTGATKETGAGRAEAEAAAVEEEEEGCTICLEKMARGDRCWLACSHYFHADCVERWLRRRPRCPLCRHQVVMPA